jgi:hypothetical protein
MARVIVKPTLNASPDSVPSAGAGVHRVWPQRRRGFAPWRKKPFIGLGAFHRNMLALEAQNFDPANTRRISDNSVFAIPSLLETFTLTLCRSPGALAYNFLQTEE